MITIVIPLFVLLWLVSSVLTFGWNFAYFQREYPTLAEENYLADILFSLAISLFPFAGLFPVYLMDLHKHGWKFH